MTQKLLTLDDTEGLLGTLLCNHVVYCD